MLFAKQNENRTWSQVKGKLCLPSWWPIVGLTRVPTNLYVYPRSTIGEKVWRDEHFIPITLSSAMWHPYLKKMMPHPYQTPDCVSYPEWRLTEFSQTGYRCIGVLLKAASWGHSCLMYLSTIWIFLFISLPWSSTMMTLPLMHPILTFYLWNCFFTKILRISSPGLPQIICSSMARKPKRWSWVSTLMNLLFILATLLSK